MCGIEGTFERGDRPAQGGYRCSACDAPARYQVQAQVLLSMYGREAESIAALVLEEEFAALSIYEPGKRGPFRRHLRFLPGYVMSGYGEDAADGVRPEDLMALSFPDESFDLVITSDVFEHVRHPYVAFREVHRVLRPGGAHVFTVPGRLPLPATTVARVDVSGPEDVHLLKPVLHNDLHLVYNDFGADLLDRLKEAGFTTEVVAFSSPDPVAATVVAHRSVKRPSIARRVANGLRSQRRRLARSVSA